MTTTSKDTNRLNPGALLTTLTIIILLLLLFLIYSAINNPGSLRLLTSGVSALRQDSCPVNIEVFINERLSDGTEVPLDLTQPDIESLNWGFSDTIHNYPYPESTISFNHPQYAIFSHASDRLTFSSSPNKRDIYPTEQNISVQAQIGPEYNFVRREIQKCSLSSNGDEWLCSIANQETPIDTISNIPFRCGINLSFGWVVEETYHESVQENGSAEPESDRAKSGTRSEESRMRSGTRSESDRARSGSGSEESRMRSGTGSEGSPVSEDGQDFSQQKPAGFITTDLNNDGVTSAIDLSYIIDSYGSVDPLADVNKDGDVNVIDFSIVATAIQKDSTR